MDIEDIEKLKKAHPELVNQIEIKFPNSSSMIDKILNSFGNKTQAERFAKEILASNPNNKKEDKHYMNINNVNDLKRAYPELINEIISDALAEERQYQIGKMNEYHQSIEAENRITGSIATGSRSSRRNAQSENAVTQINRRRNK